MGNRATEKHALKEYAAPLAILAIFEAIAVTLCPTNDNTFIFNFSYIGCSIALGLFLMVRRHRYARRA